MRESAMRWEFVPACRLGDTIGPLQAILLAPRPLSRVNVYVGPAPALFLPRYRTLYAFASHQGRPLTK